MFSIYNYRDRPITTMDLRAFPGRRRFPDERTAMCRLTVRCLLYRANREDILLYKTLYRIRLINHSVYKKKKKNTTCRDNKIILWDVDRRGPIRSTRDRIINRLFSVRRQNKFINRKLCYAFASSRRHTITYLTYLISHNIHKIESRKIKSSTCLSRDWVYP